MIVIEKERKSKKEKEQRLPELTISVVRRHTCEISLCQPYRKAHNGYNGTFYMRKIRSYD